MFTSLATTFLTPLLRHAATAAAGALVTHGVIASGAAGSTAETLTGLAIGGATVAWSWFSKATANTKAGAAIQQAATSGQVPAVAREIVAKANAALNNGGPSNK